MSTETPEKPKARVGRPPLVDLDDPAVVEELCARIAEGKGIWEVCAAEDMPTESTVWRRMARDEAFASRISRAREAQQEARIEENHRIATEATAETWQLARLRIWNNQWTASKLKPKKYGTTPVAVRHSGAVGTFDPTGMTDEQLSHLAAVLTGSPVEGGDAAPGEGGDAPEGEC